MKGWDIDVRSLYGWWGWRRRAKFHLTEDVFEAPDGNACVVFYHIGEISLAGSVGRLAVFKNKQNPQRIFKGGLTVYWYWGEDSVRWSKDGRRAFISRCEESGGWPGRAPRRFDTYLTVLDLERERWADSSQRLDDLQALKDLDNDVQLSRLDWRRFRWL